MSTGEAKAAGTQGDNTQVREIIRAMHDLGNAKRARAQFASLRQSRQPALVPHQGRLRTAPGSRRPRGSVTDVQRIADDDDAGAAQILGTLVRLCDGLVQALSDQVRIAGRAGHHPAPPLNREKFADRNDQNIHSVTRQPFTHLRGNSRHPSFRSPSGKRKHPAHRLQ